MAAVIGSPTKTPNEVKRYRINYVGDWLDTGETVITKAFAVSGGPTVPVVPLTVQSSSIALDGLSVTIFVAGGDDGETYKVVARVTTSGGQTKEDALQVAVASL